MSRIADTFAHLRSAGKRGLVAYVTAGDPDLDSFQPRVFHIAGFAGESARIKLIDAVSADLI